MIVFQYLMMSLIAYAGESTTEAAKETSVLVARLLSTAEEDEVAEIIKFLSQARNSKIRNIFFEINWSIVLVVSLILI